MPTKSAAQERLMQGVAHNPAFAEKVGIPQSVGKEFVEGDAGKMPSNEYITEPIMQATELSLAGVEIRNNRDDEMPVAPQAGPAGRAAGILFLTPEREILLMRRGDGGDFPHTFGLPGGHVEPGETLEQAARREALEETGFNYEGELELIMDDGQFATFMATEVAKFDVDICDESTGFVWCHPDEAPQPLHPGLVPALRIATACTELDVAQLMSEGVLPSPQPFANMYLLDLRITGTGMAYRSSIGEHVWRDPELYLNNEFLQRCNGLTVIMDHPESKILTSEEFKERAVGSVMLPYIKGDAVWGIAKIYDTDAMEEIKRGLIPGEEVSTSPSVVFDNTAGNITLTTESGEPLLIEGVPFLLDHIAIVTKERGSRGVWDKGGPIEGVSLNNPDEVSDMTDKVNEPKADAQGDVLNQILESIGALATRMDSMEKNLPAPELLSVADKKAKADEDDRSDDDKEGEAFAKDDRKGRKPVKADEEEEEAAKDDSEAEGGKLEGQAGEIKFDEDEEAAKSDEEEAKYADCQAKADSVYAAFGKSASRPLKGESLAAYRTRLMRGLQGYSDAYKEVNLRSIKDDALLALAEKQIFADASMAARSPMHLPAGQLIEMKRQDRAGRTISEFKGAIDAWLNVFKVPAQRVTAFHTNNTKR